jgi:hypothetical protein
MLALFLVPDFGQKIHTFVVIPSTIAELWMVGYLLVIGVKTVKTVGRRAHPRRGVNAPHTGRGLSAAARCGVPTWFASSELHGATPEPRPTAERQAVSSNARG